MDTRGQQWRRGGIEGIMPAPIAAQPMSKMLLTIGIDQYFTSLFLSLKHAKSAAYVFRGARCDAAGKAFTSTPPRRLQPPQSYARSAHS